MVMRAPLATPLLLIALLAAPAHARHTDETRVTDYSADSLDQWEWRVGPFRSAVGVFDSVEVGLNTTLLLLTVSNLYAKWTAWEGGPWSVALRAGFFRLDFSNLPGGGLQPAEGDAPFQVTAYPLELIGSYRRGSSSYHLGLMGTLVQTSGDLPSEFDADGAGAFNTVLMQGTWEWRLSDVTALVVQGQVKLSERLTANGSTRVKIDEDSFADIHGSGGGDILGAKGSLSVSAYWSWDTFNLRAGLGYGHYTVPAANIFVAAPIVFPELAMYWRF